MHVAALVWCLLWWVGNNSVLCYQRLFFLPHCDSIWGTFSKICWSLLWLIPEFCIEESFFPPFFLYSFSCSNMAVLWSHLEVLPPIEVGAVELVLAWVRHCSLGHTADRVASYRLSTWGQHSSLGVLKFLHPSFCKHWAWKAHFRESNV